MNLIEAYANLDSATKKQRLDEKIPRDLANSMKKRSDWTISAERHGSEPLGGSGWEDFENNEYNEITPEEAIKLKKQGKAGKIKALVNGQYVDFWDSGDVRTKSGYVRNSFGTLVKNADKLYFVDDSKSNANEKRAQRYKDNSLDVYTGSSWNPVQTVPIDKNTGDHDAGDNWAKYKVTRAKEYIDMYKKDLKELENLWDDGEISRKEYDRRKKSYQDGIAEEEETIKEYGPQTKNRNYDDRYAADALRMQSRIRRFQDVKDIPAERNVEDSRKNLEKAEKDYPEKIARKEAEIAKLQAEIDELKASRKNDKSYVSAFNDLKNAEARLDKKKKELADIKSGKWSVDNLKTESLKRKNKRLVESYHDTANRIILDSVDTIVDDVINGSDIEDAVHEEIDSHCLIYTDDIVDLARYYDVIDTDELSSNVYEPLFDDLYSRASDKLDKLNAGTGGIDESLNKKKSKKFTR